LIDRLAIDHHPNESPIDLWKSLAEVHGAAVTSVGRRTDDDHPRHHPQDGGEPNGTTDGTGILHHPGPCPDATRP
jgi:hypothetical protein